MSKKILTFDRDYYKHLMAEFEYDPLEFGKINFSLGKLGEEDLQMRWLCHHGGDVFAKGADAGEKSIVTTGFGMSGVPHAGTLSEILRSVTLQKAGVPVNMVIGDLDAYNGKAKPLKETLDLAEKFMQYALALGFDPDRPSRLRSQYNELGVLRTSYLIGNYMDDAMFNAAEEDLHDFYVKQGKVDADMSYRRKLSLNLMVADFLHLHTEDGFQNVLVMLGVDEHKYVRFAMETARRIKESGKIPEFDMHLAGIYSFLNRGFGGYPKMSKSFPDSSIRVDMDPAVIKKRVLDEPQREMPENDAVYQLMASASYYSPAELRKKYTAFMERGGEWAKAKKEYIDMLIDICSKWK